MVLTPPCRMLQISQYLFLSSKKPPGDCYYSWPTATSILPEGFFHYIIQLTLPSIAGGCRCAKAAAMQKAQ